LEFIIIAIIVLLILLIWTIVVRKKIDKGIERLGNWKTEIMGRNVAGQLTQIKTLNLSGETQEKFELWKDQWDTIVSKELPDMEEWLLDVEEAANRFKFRKAKKRLAELDQFLKDIENEIAQILAELDELLDSEQESRKQVQEIEPDIATLRKKISQNRHQYGSADILFEKQLDKLGADTTKYYDLVENGDYIEAKEFVDQIQEALKELEQLITNFPQMYRKSKHELPTQLDELTSGVKEMKDAGYRVESFHLDEQINEQKAQTDYITELLESGEIQKAEHLLEKTESKIQDMYDQLEQEAIAKNYTEIQYPIFEESFKELVNMYHDTKREVTNLKHKYYFKDKDIEILTAFENAIDNLKEQLNDVAAHKEENTQKNHTELRAEIEDGFLRIKELKQSLEEFNGNIDALRQDELESKEKIVEMRNQLNGMIRRLRKSNIPGVPVYIWTSIEDAYNEAAAVVEKLDTQPLNMETVQGALEAAQKKLDETTDKVNDMLDKAHLTEKMIQYANRYRSSVPALAEKLSEAERLFRSYEYDLALEMVSGAIEGVEPGATKWIEENQVV